ncbi:MAG: hypothetical protein ACXADX_02510 [Candidatus Hodarchaeales archaeon]|jgi:hypothetical protein
MAPDDLSFEIVPRFYITCFYANEQDIFGMREELSARLKGLDFQLDSFTITELEPFNYRAFHHLGFVRIDLKPLALPAPEPQVLFPVSQAIEELCNEYNTESLHLICDSSNPPYAVNIATHASKDLEWSHKAILQYKKPLGKWIEFYSGQWPDYSDELYLSRVENNLSNRLSELHFIRFNSGFIFMPSTGFDRFMPYMDQYFIEQILRVRSLLYCYNLLNDEIDNLNRRFPELQQSPLAEIENEIGRVEDLDRLIQELASRVFKERIINRRAHSKKVLNVCFDLFQIELVSKKIEEKIVKLQQALSSEREEQQTRLSNQQKKWLLILNLLLGSQIAFTLRDNIKDQFSLEKDDLLVLLLDLGVWGFVVIAALIAAGGLAYTWLSKRINLPWS